MEAKQRKAYLQCAVNDSNWGNMYVCRRKLPHYLHLWPPGCHVGPVAVGASASSRAWLVSYGSNCNRSADLALWTVVSRYDVHMAAAICMYCTSNLYVHTIHAYGDTSLLRLREWRRCQLIFHLSCILFSQIYTPFVNRVVKLMYSHTPVACNVIYVHTSTISPCTRTFHLR